MQGKASRIRLHNHRPHKPQRIYKRANQKTSFWDRKIVQYLLAPIIAAGLVTAPTVLVQNALDNKRSTREAQAANLQYVRENSSAANTARTYGNIDLRNQTLTGLNFNGAFAPSADFSESNMGVTTFVNANVPGANFSRTNMSGANFLDANAGDADFSEANLDTANFEYAWLKGADFSNANLGFATLTNAFLTGADFRGAILTKAIGLDPDVKNNVCFDENTIWPNNIRLNETKGHPRWCF